MSNNTEAKRREMVASINSRPRSRSELELVYDQVWSGEEMRNDFTVLGFGAPFIVVERKSDGKKGSLMFQHHPRFYFEFQEHCP